MERRIQKLLIANRGEIAVRIIRAAHDSGIPTVAIYSDGDRNALHASMADEAYSLVGLTAGETYLNIEKIIRIAQKSGADAIHPGYGFLAENADFARAVIDSNMVWVGPSPEAIEVLGDKISARQIAEKVGAPLAPGTKEPVKSAKEVLDFVGQHGLPVAIKAAYGGGGRGIKVAREGDDVAELFESATREAIQAFGRGECFVEKYLDKPRHVETQCLADNYGNVVVVSTRDCSVQRRHQKLVEEAPAPFISEEQNTQLYEASKNILKQAGYSGAGTCEFLIGADGTISFLEVNTRLQVEHPVSEEVTGLDLVREQLRIAEGGKIEYSDPEVKGHSFEFRINGEDPGRDFMPTPGKIQSIQQPSGPGIRFDSGVKSGDTVSGNFDSMLAKLIVTGEDREQALQRARRALDEIQIHGLPTVIPFHRLLVNEPSFTAEGADFSVFTRWVETEWTNEIEPWAGIAEFDDAETLSEVTVEVDGQLVSVSLPSRMLGEGVNYGKPPRRKQSHQQTSHSGIKGNLVFAPMQSNVVKIAVKNGDHVNEGDLLLVLEAMKMEQPVTAHRSGKISGMTLEPGATLSAGTKILEIED
jgi:acetyl-CoA/propionyl-CoA carboxylase biotin carboxyl carrier protein